MIYMTAIHLQGGHSHEHIGRMRWRNPQNAEAGESSTVDLVSWIDEGGAAKVRDRNGRDVLVAVVRPPGRPAHLRTHADKAWNNNLGALPKF